KIGRTKNMNIKKLTFTHWLVKASSVVSIIVVLGIIGVLAGAKSSTEIPAPGGWLNIQAFGAVPGDQHNDNVAIQKAIDQASENGGGVVYIPSGVYLIGKALNINASSVTLKGNGRSSVLKN